MCTFSNLITTVSQNEFFIFFYKLVLASLLAGLLGLERERKGQAAGLRTHIILCIGAMLAMHLSFNLYKHYPNITVDRIPGQVITGIGFLGAGAILRFGVSIKGLTTAAGLWTAAIIGLTVGAGCYGTAAVTAIAVFTVVSLLDIIEKKLKHTKHSIIVSVLINTDSFSSQKIFKEFQHYDISLNQIENLYSQEKKKSQMEFRLSWFQPLDIDDIIRKLKSWEGMEKINIKSENK